MKRMLYLIICFLGLLFAGGACVTGERPLGENEVCFTQSGNSSAGRRWECSLSNTNVIRQKDCYDSRSFIGPGYQQNWVFDIVGAGEVSIFWQQYTSGSSKKNSYMATYSFDENGNYTTVFDSKAEAEKDAKEVMELFVKKDAEQLLECFYADLKENRREETLQDIEKAFSFLDGDISSCVCDDTYLIRQLYQDFHIYFWCGSVFFNIMTVNGKKYRASVNYNRVWEEHPEYEGKAEYILMWNEEKEEVVIGRGQGTLYPEDD